MFLDARPFFKKLFSKGSKPMGTTNLKALQDAVKLIVDAVNDSIKVAATGGNPLVALASYQNLIPDLMTLAPEIGEIPALNRATL